MRFALLGLLFAVCACTKIIHRPSPEVTWDKGRLLYKGQLFDGVVLEDFENVGTYRKTEYRKGLEHGSQEEIFRDTGRKVAHREFTWGRNTGAHEGWFLDGRRRFHYEYNDEGESHGDHWEWYQNGTPSSLVRFEHNKVLGRKKWRDDGKVYMNYVFNDERAIGTPGTKLCFQVRN